MSDYISRQAAISALKAQAGTLRTWVEPYANQRVGILTAVNIVEDIKPSDVVPVVRCKDCKHFELNPVTVIDDIPLILAHEICTFWGNGCKTAQDGFCSFGERREE